VEAVQEQMKVIIQIQDQQEMFHQQVHHKVILAEVVKQHQMELMEMADTAEAVEVQVLKEKLEHKELTVLVE
jgi:hypothetical protein